jgi:hypothetical protein
VYDDGIDDSQAESILVALRAWATGHPAREEPFMAIMGEEPSSLITPLEFLTYVEQKTPIGLAFMRFVVSQAQHYNIPAAEFVYRAVEANRFPPIGRETP